MRAALLLLAFCGAAAAQTANPIYKVAPNGTLPDRPAYTVVQPTGPTVGVQSGRVKVGEACDCEEPIYKGSQPYCPIPSQPNKVAICKAYPPPDPIMNSGLNGNLTDARPLPSSGTDKMQLRDTTDTPVPGSGGALRAVCDFVGYRYDDPIVHFQKPGVSHLHTFVGNVSADANSTTASLMLGNSACRGGIANRSSYWVTTLLDMRTMKPVPFSGWITYYKNGRFNNAKGYGWTDAAGVWKPVLKPDGTPKFPGFTPIPNGLKAVAGDPMAMAPGTTNPLIVRWKCEVPNVGGTQYSQIIPDCPVGSSLYQEVYFPQCWDGVNLDSPNHKDHLAHPVNVPNEGDPKKGTHVECPATHPVVIPQVSLNVAWQVTEVGQTKNYRVSADSDLTLPPGIRNHGDMFIVWDESIKALWHKNCTEANADCHAHLLGDGKMLAGPP